MTHKIRPMAPRDIPAVLDMIAALAAFHDDVPQITEHTLSIMAFGPLPCLKVLVADGSAGLVGYAALIPTAKLQAGQVGCEVHHLFVKPRVRGTGVGRSLIDACKADALRRGARYLSLGTAPGNNSAGAFYEKRGFERRTDAGPRFRLDMAASVA